MAPFYAAIWSLFTLRLTYNKTRTQIGYYTIGIGECDYILSRSTTDVAVRVAKRIGKGGNNVFDRWKFLTPDDVKISEQTRATIGGSIVPRLVADREFTCLNPNDAYERTVSREGLKICPNGWQLVSMTFWFKSIAEVPATVVINNKNIRLGR